MLAYLCNSFQEHLQYMRQYPVSRKILEVHKMADKVGNHIPYNLFGSVPRYRFTSLVLVMIIFYDKESGHIPSVVF